ncbi:UDP-2,4-diacetamido-2,4,6-trideoxy-beta-L-altropyranose hydrolase [Selenomonas ruminantium]|uniref:Glycosyltransferase family 28 C-terminal domain-containing protein n=1 Tax=Selenomonas ruminantium TaxID=971 RepID=A0A1H0TYQ3_SELRU|nr:UDP-2,4-diacetamido-2,4,6-trideoxy-beta-L-altropyranose hydrolase [Selenomonas ruminantium]SDP59021.1 Glycosyltransferase family 28 C-terminal domain-containing protein [Selenomonas ruminantium]
MKIVIRVDSSVLIGSGHLMRCLTLAQRYSREGHEVIFVCRDLAGNIAGLVQQNRFVLEMLPKAEDSMNLSGYAKWLTVTQAQDAEDTIEVLKGLGKVDRLVVDSYALDIVWERLLRHHVGEIMVIDDLANREHDCDILLDQNFYLDIESRYQGLVPEHCQMLLGPEHALLREEFYRVKDAMRTCDGQIHNILVFYGGVDATDETTKAIKALISLKEAGELADVQVTAVVGASNGRKDNIAELCHIAGFTYLCQVSNMAELMAEADFMLGAGGSTTWERCFLQLPAIVTAIAENQFQICEDCAEVGLIYYLGHWDEVSQENISQAIREMSATSKRIAMQRKMSQLMG